MTKPKDGCWSRLKTKLCIIAVAFCLIFAGTTLYLLMQTNNAPSESSKQQVERYPFFPHSESDESRIRKMVDNINAANLSWKAEYNAHASLEGALEWRVSDVDKLKLEGHDLATSLTMQIIGDTEQHLTKLAAANITIPEAFDARDQWPRCSSIHHIQNQGGCGSCWAAASVSVMSDRLCISSDSRIQKSISMQDLVACCDFCGKCTGSEVAVFPFLHWTRNGIVTGGPFGSNEGCKPYEIESTCGTPCSVHYVNKSFNPQCNRNCNRMFSGNYEDDLQKGKSFYWLKIANYYSDGDAGQAHTEMRRIIDALSMPSNELIKRDILKHGPVAFCTAIAEPFLHYRKGIFYTASMYDFNGAESANYGHCMRIIGWGRANGEEFWTIANSWGRHWGENGFGRLSMRYQPEYLSVFGGLW